jgi:hypothetical protein
MLHSDRYSDNVISATRFIAKLALYMGLKEMRQVPDPFGRGGIGRKRKGGSVMPKSQRRASYRRILIGPEGSAAERTLRDSANGSIAAHYRRGHFRLQACGPKRAERRVTWIEPVLVNAKMGAAGKRDYTITAMDI